VYPRSVNGVAHSGETAELGNYRLTSPVAVGAFALLQRAHLVNAPDRQCVVKRLRPEYRNETELSEVMLGSARAGLSLSTPHVARILDVQENPEPYVVSEYVDGVNLRVLLESATRSDAVRYLIPVLVDALQGLQALHELRAEGATGSAFVHGAPCARHIVVGSSDGMGRLVDLTHARGCALPWSARREEFLLSSEMAPEQVLAPAHVDARCDLFIVGGVLWHLLTGRRLFEAENAEASLQSVLRESIPLPSEAGSEAGRGLDRICMRALQRSRSERYASAGEMAAALQEEAARADLCAGRAEIGLWVRAVGLSIAARIVPSSLTTTIAGIGPGSVSDSAATALPPPFRPARPAHAQSAARAQVEACVSAREPSKGSVVERPGTPRMDCPPAVDVSAPSVDARPPMPSGMFCSPPGRPASTSARAREQSDERMPTALSERVKYARAESQEEVTARAREAKNGEVIGVLDAPVSWREVQGSVAPRRSVRPRGRAPVMPRGLWIAGLSAGLLIAGAIYFFRGEAEFMPRGAEKLADVPGELQLVEAKPSRRETSPPEEGPRSATLDALLEAATPALSTETSPAAAPPLVRVERPTAARPVNRAKLQRAAVREHRVAPPTRMATAPTQVVPPSPSVPPRTLQVATTPAPSDDPLPHNPY
jgi:hypothetical protein